MRYAHGYVLVEVIVLIVVVMVAISGLALCVQSALKGVSVAMRRANRLTDAVNQLEQFRAGQSVAGLSMSQTVIMGHLAWVVTVPIQGQNCLQYVCPVGL